MMISKDYADRILNNVKETLVDANYFKCTKTMCRDIEKVREAIQNGFVEKN